MKRGDILLIPAATLERVLQIVTDRLLPAPGDIELRQLLTVLVRALDYQAPGLPVTASHPNPSSEFCSDRPLCARMIANRSARLLRLLELGAPEIIIESERRLIARALAQFPIDRVSARDMDSVDALDSQGGVNGSDRQH